MHLPLQVSQTPAPTASLVTTLLPLTLLVSLFALSHDDDLNSQGHSHHPPVTYAPCLRPAKS